MNRFLLLSCLLAAVFLVSGCVVKDCGVVGLDSDSDLDSSMISTNSTMPCFNEGLLNCESLSAGLNIGQGTKIVNLQGIGWEGGNCHFALHFSGIPELGSGKLDCKVPPSVLEQMVEGNYLKKLLQGNINTYEQYCERK